MRQEERWTLQYAEIMKFIEQNKRRPSKYKPEERPMLHWIKYNKKCLAKGLLTDERKELFEQLLAKAECFRRLNQYSYFDVPHPSAPSAELFLF